MFTSKINENIESIHQLIFDKINHKITKFILNSSTLKKNK